MYAGLKQSVLHERHNFKPVTADMTALHSKSERLSRSPFQPTPKDRSLPFEQAASPTQGTEWFSPNAANTTLPFADCEFLRCIGDAHHLLSKAWLGEVVDIKHKVMLALPSPGGPQWCLGLAHFSGSGCLVWPARRVDLPSGETFFELVQNLLEPRIVAITDLNFDACLIEWKSWAWQVKRVPSIKEGFQPALRAFAQGAIADIKQVASAAGWWTMSRTTLVRFCKELGVRVDDGATLFGVLLNLVEHCRPDIGEEEHLALVRTRLGHERAQLTYADELFEIQEAVEFLDTHDKKLVSAEKAATRHKECSYNDLRAALNERVKQVRDRAAAKAKAVANAAPQGAGRRRAHAKSAPARPRFNFSISHAEAAEHLPQGASIWRARTRMRWCGHCPPNRRISFGWAASGGEREAMIACIRRLWQQHLELTGQDASACPYSDLL